MPLIDRKPVPYEMAAPPFAAARNSRSLSTPAVVGTIAACLIIGHLAIAAYFPSVAINSVGLVLVTLCIGSVIFLKGDIFAGLLVIFFCSQFRYANNQGGLFNLIAFLLLGMYVLLKPVGREMPRSKDTTIGFLLSVLVVSNIMGLLLRNPMPLPVIGLQLAAFSGILLAFYVASTLRLTEARLRQFLTVAGIMAAYNFAVSLNQHYAVIEFDTPLLGLTKELFYATSNAFGTFGSGSSNGQYAMLLIALLLPLLAASASRGGLRLKPLYFVPVILMCGLTIVLSNMRAAAIEVVVILMIYTIMFSLLFRRSFRNAKYVHMASVAAIILLFTAGVWFGLGNMEHDFESVQFRGVASLESGKALNRFEPWQYGWTRLTSESWWVGYGHGNEESNLIAWGGQKLFSGRGVVGGGHLHNLYLALPMLYGWTGAVAYVLIFLVVLFRLIGAVRRHPLGNLMVVTCLGFGVSIAFFLGDETKSGNAVQYVNYPMIVWIWLGLALAALRTLRSDYVIARAQRSQQRRETTESEEASAELPPEAEDDLDITEPEAPP